MRESKSPVDRCPYCGSDYGYYTKQQAHGPVRYNYEFDGSESDNGEMYNCLSYTGGKYAYCAHCDKRLFKMED